MRVVLSFLLGIFIVAPLAAQEKPRIYIAASAAWRQNDEGDGAKAEAEVRTVEIAADFSHSCGSVDRYRRLQRRRTTSPNSAAM